MDFAFISFCTFQTYFGLICPFQSRHDLISLKKSYNQIVKGGLEKSVRSRRAENAFCVTKRWHSPLTRAEGAPNDASGWRARIIRPDIRPVGEGRGTAPAPASAAAGLGDVPGWIRDGGRAGLRRCLACVDASATGWPEPCVLRGMACPGTGHAEAFRGWEVPEA